uniref:Transcriptional activator protein n=1 Tax=Kudzu mosaic virus TaxID=390437 RepID=B8YJH4_9GEMI|nr:AC2 [Kudzu mosaic virus]
MLSSTHSLNRCSPPSIKAQHRLAKKRAIRRRRIDLKCGCSYYLHINCYNHGFSHRGVHHCGSASEWRLYLGGNKSPEFQDHGPRQSMVPTPHPVAKVQNNNTHHAQPLSEESVGDTQGLPGLDDLPSFHTADWDDFFGL